MLYQLFILATVAVLSRAQLFTWTDGSQTDVGYETEQAYYRVEAAGLGGMEAVTMGSSDYFTCRWVSQPNADPWHIHTDSDLYYRVSRGKGYLHTNSATLSNVRNSRDSFTLVPKNVAHKYVNLNEDYSSIWACYSPSFASGNAGGDSTPYPSTGFLDFITNQKPSYGSFQVVGKDAIDLDDVFPACSCGSGCTTCTDCQGNLIDKTDNITIVARSACSFVAENTYHHGQDVVVTVVKGSAQFNFEDKIALLNEGDSLLLAKGTKYQLWHPSSVLTQMMWAYSPNPNGNYRGTVILPVIEHDATSTLVVSTGLIIGSILLPMFFQ